jgi:O-acetyl-ADP-ribose deacetylase (regulator of RNase III)
MRVRQALKRENMSDAGIKWHIDRLRAKKRTPTKRQAPVAVATATRVRKHGRIEVSIVYGDITSRTYMSTFEGTRMAVVSPDDTLLTAGGGVAEGLLAKAGPQFILNELAKFGKIEQGQVVVTSGGNLPVEYVFHAAALQVQEEAYAVSKQSVYASVEQTLQKAEALDVQTLWVPLMGTGAGTLDERDSIDGIFEAIRDWKPKSTTSMTIVVFIYDFTTLDRHVAEQSMRKLLSSQFSF